MEYLLVLPDSTFKQDPTKQDTVAGEIYPVSSHQAVSCFTSKVHDLYEGEVEAPDSGARFNLTLAVNSPHWESWSQMYTQGKVVIKMTTLVSTPHAEGGSFCMMDSKGTITPACKLAFSGSFSNVGGYIIDSYNPREGDIDNYGHSYLGTTRAFCEAQGNAFCNSSVLPNRHLEVAQWSADLTCVSTQVELSGIPVTVTTAQLGGVLPARYWNYKVADAKSVVPTVSKNQAAHSVVPGLEHQKAVLFAVAACKSRHMKSVTTTFIDK